MSDDIARIAGERGFPILEDGDGPKKFVPWSAVATHEAQAQRNHRQSLKRLAERGGLGWCELAAVLEDRAWRPMTEEDARAALRAYLERQP